MTVPIQGVALIGLGGTVGLVAGGAHRRGRRDVHAGRQLSPHALERRRKRSGIGLGVALGIVALNTLARGLTMAATAKRGPYSDYVGQVLWVTLNDVAMAGAAVASAYHAHARGYERERRIQIPGVAVGFAPGGATVTLGMRF